MAVIETPLSLKQIHDLAGTLDYYCWKGLHVVREWPRNPNQPGTPLQKQTWAGMSFAHSWQKQIPSQWYQDLSTISFPIGWSKQDYVRKVALRSYHAAAVFYPTVFRNAYHTAPPFSSVEQIQVRYWPYPNYLRDGSQIAIIPFDDKLPEVTWVPIARPRKQRNELRPTYLPVLPVTHKGWTSYVHDQDHATYTYTPEVSAPNFAIIEYQTLDIAAQTFQ